MATESKAILKFARISPRKVRLVVDLIRGKAVSEAFNILNFTTRSASPMLKKGFNTAVANSENLEIGDPDDLWVKTAFVDGGPVLKRFKARSMGRANPIKKRTSHITLVLGVKEKKEPQAKTAAADKA